MSVEREVYKSAVWVLSSDAVLSQLISFGLGLFIYYRRGLSYSFFKCGFCVFLNLVQLVPQLLESL